MTDREWFQALLERAVSRAGSGRKLAARLGVSHPSVVSWKKGTWPAGDMLVKIIGFAGGDIRLSMPEITIEQIVSERIEVENRRLRQITKDASELIDTQRLALGLILDSLSGTVCEPEPSVAEPSSADPKGKQSPLP